MFIPNELSEILDALIYIGARPYLVGGCVRDYIMEIEPKDYDVEVFNMYPEQLEFVLSKFGQVDIFGKSFGILKVRGFEFSLPRRDNKVAEGHKGFNIVCDPKMSVEDACSRRDFTMNSMAYDPQTDQIIDPFGGQYDIKIKRLDPTSEAFKEDILRVLRAFQFASRFSMHSSLLLNSYAKEIKGEYIYLPKERVWGEWQKWAEKSIAPSRGLALLRDTTWIELYPELTALIGCKQDPEWHPEGDVWNHTLLVCDSMANICKRENIAGEDKVVLMLAALCHDLGKPATTFVREDGRIVSPGHAEVGVDISRKFLNSIGCFPRIIEKVIPLVKEHLSHIQKDISPRTVRRLANRLYPATIKELGWLAEADHSGRRPLPGGMPEGMRNILKIAEEVYVADQKPIHVLTGKMLIACGVEPGKKMGEILDKAFEAQLNGEFRTKEESVIWFYNNYKEYI